MGCGCGGSSKVYKAPSKREATEKPVRPYGLPKVWNGPKAKTA